MRETDIHAQNQISRDSLTHLSKFIEPAKLPGELKKEVDLFPLNEALTPMDQSFEQLKKKADAADTFSDESYNENKKEKQLKKNADAVDTFSDESYNDNKKEIEVYSSNESILRDENTIYSEGDFSSEYGSYSSYSDYSSCSFTVDDTVATLSPSQDEVSFWMKGHDNFSKRLKKRLEHNQSNNIDDILPQDDVVTWLKSFDIFSKRLVGQCRVAIENSLAVNPGEELKNERCNKSLSQNDIMCWLKSNNEFVKRLKQNKGIGSPNRNNRKTSTSPKKYNENELKNKLTFDFSQDDIRHW
eukprot:CAMPEP_0113317638 /NCGR_PEP_ID=MMETSP0010_2-20120614/12464_1 /TAXON_ID=216773 ORGANISM="Corethron hystrix, Strain 308" /NCGR_SAMPLE_ID=MMETSP0010_2 /ASSEMBLY_ACC=CAM_ASM_000155 /LENGTH=299 /DNA_ID=CAMNT_0000174655 /DNA_START=6 /DNA_END=902 /DNA_ORIENTATION=+ /assembly_acc=CAM_ASM_000155